MDRDCGWGSLCMALQNPVQNLHFQAGQYNADYADYTVSRGGQIDVYPRSNENGIEGSSEAL